MEPKSPFARVVKLWRKKIGGFASGKDPVEQLDWKDRPTGLAEPKETRKLRKQNVERETGKSGDRLSECGGIGHWQE